MSGHFKFEPETDRHPSLLSWWPGDPQFGTHTHTHTHTHIHTHTSPPMFSRWCLLHLLLSTDEWCESCRRSLFEMKPLEGQKKLVTWALVCFSRSGDLQTPRALGIHTASRRASLLTQTPKVHKNPATEKANVVQDLSNFLSQDSKFN